MARVRRTRGLVRPLSASFHASSQVRDRVCEVPLPQKGLHHASSSRQQELLDLAERLGRHPLASEECHRTEIRPRLSRPQSAVLLGDAADSASSRLSRPRSAVPLRPPDVLQQPRPQLWDSSSPCLAGEELRALWLESVAQRSSSCGSAKGVSQRRRLRRSHLRQTDQRERSLPRPCPNDNTSASCTALLVKEHNSPVSARRVVAGVVLPWLKSSLDSTVDSEEATGQPCIWGLSSPEPNIARGALAGWHPVAPPEEEQIVQEDGAPLASVPAEAEPAALCERLVKPAALDGFAQGLRRLQMGGGSNAGRRAALASAGIRHQDEAKIVDALKSVQNLQMEAIKGARLLKGAS